MSQSPRLGLPFLATNQSQKHVTLNEALRRLDLLVDLTLVSRALDTPPPSPADWAAYLVATDGQDGWSGQDGNLAGYQDGAWTFIAPFAGLAAYIEDEALAVLYGGAGWAEFPAAGAEAWFARLGVNTAPDAGNVLPVSGASILFYNSAGSHRLSLNKSGDSETASLVFQSAFSGRAEFGLTGDANFHVKVSADGSSWTEAIMVEADGGQISVPQSSAATPAIAFHGDSDTGLFSPGAHSMSIGLGGGEVLHFQRSGAGDARIGIGNDNPTVTLDIGTTDDEFTHILRMLADASAGGAALYWGDQDNGAAGRIQNAHNQDIMSFDTDGQLRMAVRGDGKVGIGTGAPTTQLDVVGPVRIQAYNSTALPSASSSGEGAVIVIRTTGQPHRLAVSDGSSWI